MVTLRITLIALASTLTGCVSTPPAETTRDDSLRLEVLAWTLIPAEHDTFGTVGGISGALFRPHAFYDNDARGWAESPLDDDNRAPLELVSDEPGNSRTLIGGLSLRRTGDTYGLDIDLDYERSLDWAGATDAEGIARAPLPQYAPLRRGEFFACVFESPPSVCVVEYSPPHRWQVRYHQPTLPETIAARMRPNRAFESVAYASDGTLWVATESALTTDGEEPTSRKGALCTVLTGDHQELHETFFYETDPKPAHLGPTFSIHSLAEFEALPDGRLLTLERSLTLPAGYSVKLFVIDGTTDERRIARLPILDKKLVVDLGTLARDAGVPWIGNLEALALGPSVASLTGDENEEGRLLLVVADDNFGTDIQRTGTQVIALRIVVARGF